MKAFHFISASTTLASPDGGDSRAVVLWRVVGIVVLAAMLAKWTWVFLAPKEVALPTTAAWKKTSDANHLFGNVPATGTSSFGSLGNVQLVGVFAHKTAGFAVLSVDGKQVGVGLGELVVPGARLVETKAGYVLIERGGIRLRVDLLAGKPTAGIANANSTSSNAVSTPEAVAQAAQISPEQRAAMQQELEYFRRRP